MIGTSWLPDGLGEFARWMKWLTLLFIVMLSGMMYIVHGSPWASVFTMPVTLGYFLLWVPAQRRIIKRMRTLEGRVCYHCGFEMDARVGARCIECGHVQTEKGRRAIDTMLKSWSTSSKGV
mgnify:CR=1 FL=1